MPVYGYVENEKKTLNYFFKFIIYNTFVSIEVPTYSE